VTHHPELDALIVRNIGDVGAAANRAKNDIDPRLWTESGIVANAAAAAMGWLSHVDVSDEAVWLTHRNWLQAADEVDDPPFFLRLNEREEPGVDAEWTWLASFTGAWPGRGRMGLFVGYDHLTNGAWKKQLRTNSEIVDALIARGFRYDSPAGDLYVPFIVSPELLATAFEEDSFETALQPLADAIGIAGTARAELDALHHKLLVAT
jgi:hypothetical protein